MDLNYEENFIQGRYLWGLDVSLTCTGIAIYDLDNDKWAYIGHYRTDKVKQRAGTYLDGAKLRLITDHLYELLKEYPPMIIGIERPFIHTRNHRASEMIYLAHGAILTLISNYPVEYVAIKSAKALIIHGNATKAEVSEAILKVYPELTFSEDVIKTSKGIKQTAGEDESDATSIAITLMARLEIKKWTKPVSSISEISKKIKKKKEDK